MNVTEAVLSRHSVRAFLDRPVSGTLLRDIVQTASRAPSSSNIQPWLVKVIGGTPLGALKEVVKQRREQTPPFETPDYMIYPPELKEPYFERRAGCAANNYAAFGVDREDHAGRMRFLHRCVEFFDAPIGLFCFIDRDMGPSQWADLGAYTQTLMLLLHEAGLSSCPQISWTLFSRTVADFFKVPPDLMLYCGMSIGYRDTASSLGHIPTPRAPIEEFAEFVGI